MYQHNLQANTVDIVTYVGVPTLVNQDGAVKIYELPLDEKEKALFDQSVKTLEDIYNSIKYLLEDK